MSRHRRVLLVGNPNCGKTTLFNALTGLSARVGNYPGVTVEHLEGEFTVDNETFTVIDLPGTYSLVPRSDDEAVTTRGILGQLPGLMGRPDLIVAVVDATALERNLYLLTQLRELPLTTVVALTMGDTLTRDELTLDTAALSQRVSCPVVQAPAGQVQALRTWLAGFAKSPPESRTPQNPPRVRLPEETLAAGKRIAAAWDLPHADVAVAQMLTCAAAASAMERLPLNGSQRTLVSGISGAGAEVVIAARYDRAKQWAQSLVTGAGGRRIDIPRSARINDALDRFLLHAVAGPLTMLVVFLGLFWALFSGAEPLVAALEGTTAWLSEQAAHVLPSDMPLLRSLVQNGLIAGVGNVVVFVPQIAILFLFLAVLEDSGYLARAAFLLDRVMAKTGLHGRAFVPLLSGFACAVPAILATRTIENNKDRLVTILALPFVSCSARLPVYALMTATVFSGTAPVWGVIPVGALAMVAMYALSISAALIAAFVLKRTALKSPTPPLVLELPPYRWPRLSSVLRVMLQRVRVFLLDAGTTILAITVVLWGLFTFPRDENLLATAEAARTMVTQSIASDDDKAQQLARIDARLAQEQIGESIAGQLGHAIAPLTAPLGFDWKLTVGIIASFAAREVLVSTLGLVYGLGEGADADEAHTESLRTALKRDRRPDGRPVYTPLSALSVMVFFVLAMQCMSTLAAVRRETGGLKWPLIQLGFMTTAAYGASLMVFQLGRLLGF